MKGVNPIIAHPERYIYFKSKDYQEFINRGVLLQINLLSLTEFYSIEIQQKAEKLINENMVNFIGTDCHNMTQASLYAKCQIKYY